MIAIIDLLISVLSVLAGFIVLLLIIALFTRKQYNIRREITIDAPQQTVFDYLKQLKNQDHFNKWVMVDPDMEKTFTGTDGTTGFIYAWNGNKKAGAGEQEIKNITEGTTIETEIRFIRPFAGIAYANMTTAVVADHQTKVTWSNASNLKYPLNILISTIEKMLAKDMDTSLLTLKNNLEK